MTMAAAQSSYVYGQSLRVKWCLEDGATFLNHGAFGATPSEILAVQQEWRACMEKHPTQFFMEDLQPQILDATKALAKFVGAPPEQTVLVENATTGICTVLQSLQLPPKAKIVTTSHVYNAVRNALKHMVSFVGGSVIEVAVPLPVTKPQDFLDALKSQVDEAIDLVVIDHIASPSALILPVRDITDHCRKMGVPVLVDGSHAPSSLDLNISALGADWYVGNCHKWMCAPKGAAFLVVQPGAERNLHPMAVSHAYGSGFKAEFGKVGSRDASPWLSIPAAIRFHEALGGAELRKRNRKLALAAGKALATALETQLAGPEEMFGPMVSVRLPAHMGQGTEQAAELTKVLWRDHRIDVLIVHHSDALWMRVSVHAYCDMADVDALISALSDISGAMGASHTADAATC